MRKPRKHRNRPARPTLFSEQVSKRLCDAISLGATIDEACRRVGIHRDTFFAWQQSRSDFSDSVQDAKERRLEVLEEAWARAGRKDWKAAQAMLRVLKPKKFAERLMMHIDNELDEAMKCLAVEFKDEPALYKRAIFALAGRSSAERGDGTDRSGASGDGGGDGEGVEAVHPSPTVGAAEPIPRP